MTALSLFGLDHFAPGAGKHVELLVLVIANLVATATRFVGLRWVFRSHLQRRPAAGSAQP